MAWSYSGDPSGSDQDAIRFEIQDTNAAAPLLQDTEIVYAIFAETGLTASPDAVSLDTPQLYSSAARCCEVLVRNFSMQPDRTVGSLEISYSKTASNYATLAKELRAKAAGYNAPYAGGLSRSEKESWRQDEDAVQPVFSRGQFNSPWSGNTRRGGLPPMPS